VAGMALYAARANDQAMEVFRKSLELDSNDWFARMYLGLTYEAKGDLPRALAELQPAVKVVPDFAWPLAELGHVYALSGRKADAEKILRQITDLSGKGYVPAYAFAEIYLGLGDRQNALASLEKAYDDRSMILAYVKADPEFDSLHSDPRFKALMRRMGLPE